jgi:hypothetical protein
MGLDSGRKPEDGLKIQMVKEVIPGLSQALRELRFTAFATTTSSIDGAEDNEQAAAEAETVRRMIEEITLDLKTKIATLKSHAVKVNDHPSLQELLKILAGEEGRDERLVGWRVGLMMERIGVSKTDLRELLGKETDLDIDLLLSGADTFTSEELETVHRFLTKREEEKPDKENEALTMDLLLQLLTDGNFKELGRLIGVALKKTGASYEDLAATLEMEASEIPDLISGEYSLSESQMSELSIYIMELEESSYLPTLAGLNQMFEARDYRALGMALRSMAVSVESVPTDWMTKVRLKNLRADFRLIVEGHRGGLNERSLADSYQFLSDLASRKQTEDLDGLTPGSEPDHAKAAELRALKDRLVEKMTTAFERDAGELKEALAEVIRGSLAPITDMPGAMDMEVMLWRTINPALEVIRDRTKQLQTPPAETIAFPQIFHLHEMFNNQEYMALGQAFEEMALSVESVCRGAGEQAELRKLRLDIQSLLRGNRGEATSDWLGDNYLFLQGLNSRKRAENLVGVTHKS